MPGRYSHWGIKGLQYYWPGPCTGEDTPNFFFGFWGAHRGPYVKFFIDERKNYNFWPGMMLLKLNLQIFNLFQEPLQALLRHLGAQLGPFDTLLESLVTPPRPSVGSSRYNYGAPAKTFGPLGGSC